MYKELDSCAAFFIPQSTTIILWVPLILMSVVEMVFCFRCFAVCTSFLYLCPCRREPIQARRVRPQSWPDRRVMLSLHHLNMEK